MFYVQLYLKLSQSQETRNTKHVQWYPVNSNPLGKILKPLFHYRYLPLKITEQLKGLWPLKYQMLAVWCILLILSFLQVFVDTHFDIESNKTAHF